MTAIEAFVITAGPNVDADRLTVTPSEGIRGNVRIEISGPPHVTASASFSPDEALEIVKALRPFASPEPFAPDEAFSVMVFKGGHHEHHMTPEFINCASNSIGNILRDAAYLAPAGPLKDWLAKAEQELRALAPPHGPNAATGLPKPLALGGKEYEPSDEDWAMLGPVGQRQQWADIFNRGRPMDLTDEELRAKIAAYRDYWLKPRAEAADAGDGPEEHALTCRRGQMDPVACRPWGCTCKPYTGPAITYSGVGA